MCILCIYQKMLCLYPRLIECLSRGYVCHLIGYASRPDGGHVSHVTAACVHAAWSKTRSTCWHIARWHTGLKLENYYFFTFSFSRPEVGKLFHIYFFSTWSWKIISYLLFYFFSTWSWKIISYLLFYFFSTWSWKIIPYLLFLELKLESYYLFTFSQTKSWTHGWLVWAKRLTECLADY